MKRITVVACLLALFGAGVAAQSPEQFPPEQIKKGADMFAQHCAACHGAHMADPQGAFNLRKFPHDQKSRFVKSVTRGKDNMPPWGDLLKPEDIEALWAYVMAGEKP
jgi:mono/diheme cytochrome c family protein